MVWSNLFDGRSENGGNLWKNSVSEGQEEIRETGCDFSELGQ
jgi:hypothetical protein